MEGGDFVLHSGRHSDKDFRVYVLYANVRLTQIFCYELARYFTHCKTEVVAVNTRMEMIIAHGVAQFLSEDQKTGLSAVFMESGVREMSPAFPKDYRQIIQGKRVLVMRAILETRNQMTDLAEAVSVAGGTAVAAGALFDRGGLAAADLGVPEFYSLLSVEV